MRIIFMGTPAFAVPALQSLVAAGHEIVAVYCQPPRPAGRKQLPQPAPVQLAAQALGLAIHTPTSLRTPEAQHIFAAHHADVAVVAAYGLILPQAILDAPKWGCINIHASLLPRWRGAAPIQRAILAGDAETGVTLMHMEAGLDTGPMLARQTTPVDKKTAGALTQELADMGAHMVVDMLPQLATIQATPQEEALACYAPKIDKSESRLNFHDSAEQVERAVRAYNPAPGAWVMLGAERLKILEAHVVDMQGPVATVLDDQGTIGCAVHALRPTLVQRAGRKPMSCQELLRGLSLAPGTRLA